MSDESTSSGHGLDPRGLWVVLAIIVGGLVLLGGRDNGYRSPRPEPWAGWKTTGIVVLILVGLLAAGLVVYTLVRMALSLAAAWHAHHHHKALDALDVQRTADQVETGKARAALDAARVQPWAEHGRLGALVRQTPQGWQVVNLDAEAGALLLGDSGGLDRLLADPLTLAQLQARHDLELERARASAYPGLATYTQRLQIAGGEALDPTPAPAVNWPSQVLLRDLAPDPATLGGLVLGITIFPGTGVARPVMAALSELVHVAVGGSSGWGKSVFLRALALQFATSAEPCRLVLIDLEGATFAPFARSERLLWPVADTEEGALAIMAHLVEEMNRRKELYQAFPGVDSLAAFNARAAEPLPPVIALIDEATALLSDRSVHNATRTLALRARKYGLWLVLGGQDWKAASVDTAIRNQLSTRIHFKAQSPSQSRVLLGDGCAAAIKALGRAYAQLPGQPLTELQAPLVTVADIEAALTGQTGPAETLPEAQENNGASLSNLEARLVLWAAEQNSGRFSVRAVADAHADLVSRGEVQALADRLVLDNWLLTPTKGNTAPEVTIDLEEAARVVLQSASREIGADEA
jgi:DNA segregation ATPase FtsK/SpoIIIE-like protein